MSKNIDIPVVHIPDVETLREWYPEPVSEGDMKRTTITEPEGRYLKEKSYLVPPGYRTIINDRIRRNSKKIYGSSTIQFPYISTVAQDLAHVLIGMDNLSGEIQRLDKKWTIWPIS